MGLREYLVFVAFSFLLTGSLQLTWAVRRSHDPRPGFRAELTLGSTLKAFFLWPFVHASKSASGKAEGPPWTFFVFAAFAMLFLSAWIALKLAGIVYVAGWQRVALGLVIHYLLRFPIAALESVLLVVLLAIDALRKESRRG